MSEELKKELPRLRRWNSFLDAPQIEEWGSCQLADRGGCIAE